MPAPLAVEPERGWMVLADFGEEVGWEAPMEVVEEVAQTYARMQVEATAGLPGVDAATWLLDLATIRRGTAFVDAADEAELRERLRQAYLPEWASFEPPGRLARAWELAAPLGALHQAVSYRSLATRPPGDPHMAQSTAWWLRQVLAGLA